MKQFTFALALMAFSFIACKDDCEQPDTCFLQPESDSIGKCCFSEPSYFYNQKTKECEKLDWNICNSDIPFQTLEECQICICNK